MKIIFDARVLTHKIYTGVENYANYILKLLEKNINVKIAKPITSNKYLAHLWTHTVLPFKKGKLLFCPANIAPVFILKNKKLILTLHDVSFLINYKSFSSFFKWYYKFIVPKNIKRANKIITVSEYSKQQIEKYYPDSKGKIKVIYLGIDKIYKKIDIKKEDIILYVGSVNERKNLVGILKAFMSLKINYKLILVVNFFDNFYINDELKKLLYIAKNNNKIEFLQDISNDELIKLYNKSKLFVFPSFYEGFGLPVLEAMACGTPVIASNVSSLPEVGGDAVVYCNPYDIVDIKNKIEMVLNNENLQEEMIEKGLKRAQEFTWEKASEEHIKVFKEVLDS